MKRTLAFLFATLLAAQSGAEPAPAAVAPAAAGEKPHAESAEFVFPAEKAAESARRGAGVRLSPEEAAALLDADRTIRERLAFSVGRDGGEAVELSDGLEQELVTAFKRSDAARIPSGEGEVFRIVASGRGWFQFVLPFANPDDFPAGSKPIDPAGKNLVDIRFVAPAVKAEAVEPVLAASFADFAGGSRARLRFWPSVRHRTPTSRMCSGRIRGTRIRTAARPRRATSHASFRGSAR